MYITVTVVANCDSSGTFDHDEPFRMLVPIGSSFSEGSRGEVIVNLPGREREDISFKIKETFEEIQNAFKVAGLLIPVPQRGSERPSRNAYEGIVETIVSGSPRRLR